MATRSWRKRISIWTKTELENTMKKTTPFEAALDATTGGFFRHFCKGAFYGAILTCIAYAAQAL